MPANGRWGLSLEARELLEAELRYVVYLRLKALSRHLA
jgi:hypothetical protein